MNELDNMKMYKLDCPVEELVLQYGKLKRYIEDLKDLKMDIPPWTKKNLNSIVAEIEAKNVYLKSKKQRISQLTAAAAKTKKEDISSYKKDEEIML